MIPHGRIALESLPAPLFVTRFDGTILNVNAAACRQMACSREQLINLSANELVVDIGPEVWQVVEALTGSGATIMRQAYHRRRDGSKFGAEVHLRQAELDGDRLLIVVASEIGGAGVPAVVPSGRPPDGLRPFVVVDNRGRVVLAGADAERLLGVEARSLVGRPFEPYCSPALLEAMRACLKRRAGADAAFPMPAVLTEVRAQGSDLLSVTATITPIDASGRPLACVALGPGGDDPTAGLEVDPRALARLAGRSPVMVRLRDRVRAAAASDASVLIVGESGTGKELVARAIHELGARSDRPFVSVNCAALPPGLIDNELFGHERGAFTGALARQTGRFEAAQGGTIFLDEICEMPIELQARLLRVLQERTLERLGSPRTIALDTRVVAATNRDPRAAIAAGTFRADLYYRLNVVPIHVPPLEQRPGDVTLLAERFARRAWARHGRPPVPMELDLLERLAARPWPGNVRELENLIERAVILSPPGRLELDDELEGPGDEAARLRRVLEESGWRVSGAHGAARRLGIKPTTLETRMKRLGIRRPRS